MRAVPAHLRGMVFALGGAVILSINDLAIKSDRKSHV